MITAREQRQSCGGLGGGSGAIRRLYLSVREYGRNVIIPSSLNLVSFFSVGVLTNFWGQLRPRPNLEMGGLLLLLGGALEYSQHTVDQQYVTRASLIWFITSDKGGGKCVCPRLSVRLLARLLKNACMDWDEMLHVDRCRDTDELINF